MGDFAFDADTRVMASSVRDEFAAELTGRWNGTNGAVNGGYMLAICLRALGLRMQFPDPIVVSGFFLRPGTAGPAVIGTTLTRGGADDGVRGSGAVAGRQGRGPGGGGVRRARR
jgi:hypothetical protein